MGMRISRRYIRCARLPFSGHRIAVAIFPDVAFRRSGIRCRERRGVDGARDGKRFEGLPPGLANQTAPVVPFVVRNDRKGSDETTREPDGYDDPARPRKTQMPPSALFEYTFSVLRSSLALALIVLVATLTVVDPFFCPDGCSDEPIDVDYSPSDGTDCSTCHGLGPITPSHRLAPVEIDVSSCARLVATTTSAPPRPIEHPPRTI